MASDTNVLKIVLYWNKVSGAWSADVQPKDSAHETWWGAYIENHPTPEEALAELKNFFGGYWPTEFDAAEMKRYVKRKADGRPCPSRP